MMPQKIKSSPAARIALSALATALFLISPLSSSANSLQMCDQLGDVIRKNRPQQERTGDYGKRSDVKAYAGAVADCYKLDEKWVLKTLKESTYKASSARLMMPKPAGERNWNKFVAPFIQADRVNAGVAFASKNQRWLKKAEQEYGVPEKYILGILGVETIFGQYTGEYRIVDALSTLTFDFPKERSDRTDFFADELAKFLYFSSQQKIDPSSIKGSYAGAIGMPQFMPSSILAYAVDFDGDGRIDLHNSAADIIGSVANYLYQHGWERGLTAAFSVELDDIAEKNMSKLLAPDITPTFTHQELERLGVWTPSKTAAKTPAAQLKLALIILPNGKDGEPDYVAGTQNFYVITRYNRSSFYAMAVIELSNAIEKKL